MTKAPTVAEPLSLAPAKRPKLDGAKLKLEEYVRRHHFITAPVGMTKDDLRYPECWAHLAGRVSRHDVIYVLAADESWELECRVESVKSNGVEMSISKNITRIPVEIAEIQLDPAHYVQFRPGHGWCVVRREDGHVLKDGFSTKEAASAQFFRDQPKQAA